MTFQSLEFLLFFPTVFLLYWLAGRKNASMQNGLLAAASLTFYGWWDVRFLALQLFTAGSTFAAGWLMNHYADRPQVRKACSIAALISNLGILFLFKYYNFFVQSLADAFASVGLTFPLGTLQILLPVGISFYTFSALSYSLDVYQQKIAPTKNFLAYLAYVTFFPSLLSGPINRAQKQLPQYLTARQFNYDQVVRGCRYLLWGSVMKLCLADRLGIYVDTVYGSFQFHSGPTLWLTSVLYTFQIYADFAGYSLMALGLGQMLGIELPTNFLRPYFAKTVTEFWRRWHISLTTWFRDYLYFPLGGNRCSTRRWMLNTMIVFVVSGLWHGAAYTFLIWGALHGVCMIVERQAYGSRIKNLPQGITFANAIRGFVTFFLVNLAWIFFRIDNLSDVGSILHRMVTDCGPLFTDPDTLGYAFLFGILVFAVDLRDEYFPHRFALLHSRHTAVRWSVYLALATFLLLFGVLDGGSFIYFQF